MAIEAKARAHTVFAEASDAAQEFARAVALGLSDTPRWIPVRFLYDANGSALFDEITGLPEYYVTRTEETILRTFARDVAAHTGPVTLIELGSGSSVKTSHLLEAYTAHGARPRYVAVDVSESALESARRRVAVQHPTVRFEGVTGRYEDAFALIQRHSPAMVVFLGSTIGNLAHAESQAFWEDLARHTPAGDFFLLGVDLVKDAAVLEAAYNDAAGVTARFTKNVFERMNRELGAGLDLDTIEHVARYNEEWQRIEIFAHFATGQTVHLEPLHRDIAIDAGERVLTEISRKFVLPHLEEYARCFGFRVVERCTDPNDWFAVLLLEKAPTTAA